MATLREVLSDPQYGTESKRLLLKELDPAMSDEELSAIEREFTRWTTASVQREVARPGEQPSRVPVIRRDVPATRGIGEVARRFVVDPLVGAFEGLDWPRGQAENISAHLFGRPLPGRAIPPFGTGISAEEGLEFEKGMPIENILAAQGTGITMPSAVSSVGEAIYGREFPSAGEDITGALKVGGTVTARQLLHDPLTYAMGLGLGTQAGRETLLGLQRRLIKDLPGPKFVPGSVLESEGSVLDVARTAEQQAMSERLLGRPLAPGHTPADTVTLYRVDRPPTIVGDPELSGAGAWFTDQPSTSATEVILPKDIAKLYKGSNLPRSVGMYARDAQHHYLLPPTIAGAAKPAATLEELMQQERDIIHFMPGPRSPLKKAPSSKIEAEREEFRATMLGIGGEPTGTLPRGGPADILSTEPRPRVTADEAKAVNQAVKDAQKLAVSEPTETDVSMWRKTFQAGLDVLKRTGPKGVVAAEALFTLMNQWERRTGEILVDVDDRLARVLGRRGQVEQAIERKHPWKNRTMQQSYDITRDEVKMIVDYLYTNGHMKPTGPNAAKLIEAGNVLDEYGFRPTSLLAHEAELPGIRHADGTTTPYAPAHMYYPQRPYDPAKMAKALERDKFLIYKASGYKGTFEEWEGWLYRQLSGTRGLTMGEAERLRGGELQGKELDAIISRLQDTGVHARHYPGLTNERLFDAEKLGRPSDVLEKYGYGTDPIQELFHATAGGQRAALGKMIEPKVRELVAEIRRDIKASTGDPRKGEWVEYVANDIIGAPHLDSLDRTATQWAQRFQDFNNMSLLQFGGPPQLMQMSFVFGRAGLGPIASTVWNELSDTVRSALRIKSGQPTSLADRSGATYTFLLNEYGSPTSGLGRAATGFLRGYGFNAADSEMRRFAALVGGEYAKKMAKVLVTHPRDERAIAIVKELGLDPTEVITKRGLTDKMEEIAAQNFANMTNSRTDLRTLPIWATSDNPLIRLMLQYKKFALSNYAEIIRQVGGAAPLTERAARAGRLAVGGAGMGEMVRELQMMVMHLDNPFDLPREKRVISPLRGLAREHPAAAYFIDRAIFGTGSIAGLLLYAAMEDSVDRALINIFGPTAGLIGETIAGTAKGVKGVAEKKGLREFEDLTRTYGRKIPVPIIAGGLPGLISKELFPPEPRGAIKPFGGISPFGVEQ